MAEARWKRVLERTFTGPAGSVGRVVVSWTLAGGILGGGLLIGALALAGLGGPGLHLLLAPALFLVGSTVGVVLGCVLALTGRGPDVSRGEALRGSLIGAGVAILLLPLGWLISSSITVGTALQVEMRLSWLAVSLGGAGLGLLCCAWAVFEGWAMIKSAYSRCPRPRFVAGSGQEDGVRIRYSPEVHELVAQHRVERSV
ncbi:MAG: hypothetical protein OEN56_01230 [Gemmatimonadota bacterium]|nr:hypothetical protein [Gemmatimonadota bacterium]